MMARARVRGRISMALLIVASGMISGVGALVVGSESPATAGTTITEIPGPGGTSDPADFAGVSCTSAGNCIAVGSDNSSFEPMVATETNGAWGATSDISAPAGEGFLSVSCTSAGNCTAVGTSGFIEDLQPLVATETNGVWGATADISTPAGIGALTGVSCWSAGNCTAVGGVITVSGGFAGLPIVTTETNGVWSAASNLSAPGNAGGFSSVSCWSTRNCTAVGEGGVVVQGAEPEPLVATETNGVWGAASESSTSSGQGRFYGVSCTSAGNCTAVGDDGTSSVEPLVATETSGAWDAAGDLSAPSGVGELTGVSCTSAGNCTAVGENPTALAEPFVATETSGAWSATSALSLPGDHGDLGGVSCPSTGECTAVGSDGNNEPVVAAIQAVPSVNVTDNASTTPPGGTLTFTATVTGSGGVTPTGNLTWAVTDPNHSPVSCGSTTGPTGSGDSATYTCSISGVQTGDYTATGNYAGDTSNPSATSPADVTTIAKLTPGVTVTDNSSSIAPGGTLILTATVTGSGGVTPTGDVTWTISGPDPLDDCSSTTGPDGSSSTAVYTCSIADAPAGSYSVDTSFLGDSNYNAVDNNSDTAQVGCETPVITSPANATPTPGHAGIPFPAFTVTTCSDSTPKIKATNLPKGLKLVDNGNGTATISGVITAKAAGISTATITATGTGEDKGLTGTQSLAFLVFTQPKFKSKAKFTGTVGVPISTTTVVDGLPVETDGFPVTVTGFPPPTVSVSGTLPDGVLFDNEISTLEGTPAPDAPGTYTITFTASDGGFEPSAVQTFTLKIIPANQAPVITSAATDTVATGFAMSPFTVTTAGYPYPRLTATGLPAKTKLKADAKNGTATISGTPDVPPGSYPVTITATNQFGSTTQSFTLVIVS